MTSDQSFPMIHEESEKNSSPLSDSLSTNTDNREKYGQTSDEKEEEGNDKKPEDLSIKFAQNPDTLFLIAHLIYALQALGIFFGLSGIAAGILVCLKRKDVRESWLASHYAWQLRTFLMGLGLFTFGFILTIILIGVLIWWIGAIYVIYRVIKGWLRLSERKPIELTWF